MQVIALCDEVVEQVDNLDSLNSKSITMDYADDEPRKKAVRGLDDLHRGLYGTLTERQHAQLTYILQQLTEQEKMDKLNDAIKQDERKLMCVIKSITKKLRDEYYGR